MNKLNQTLHDPVTSDDVTAEAVPAKTSKRRNWYPTERETLVVDQMPMAEAAEVGRRAGARRVFVTGVPQPASKVIADAPAGAHVFVDGHYPALTVDGVSVTCAAQWWSARMPADTFRTYYGDLQDAVRAVWRDRRIQLLSNPSSTGMDLWARSLTREFPVMDAEWASLVRSSGGQGRVELYPARVRTGVELHEYDQRWSYVGCLRRMPVGNPSWITSGIGRWTAGDEVAARRATGRYRVTAQAPSDWTGPGIIGWRDEDGAWYWPSRPTHTGNPETWASGEEISIAVRFGWSIHVHDGCEWAESAEPFRLWADRLIHIAGRDRGKYATPVRAMLLHTIGAMHGAARKVTRVGDVPGDQALGIRAMASGGYTWHELAEPRNQDMHHPEWTTAVWSRARARLMSHRGFGLLHVPAGQLVAARTDAVFTTRPMDAGKDDGKPGNWRVKSVSRRMAWPSDATAILTRKLAK